MVTSARSCPAPTSAPSGIKVTVRRRSRRNAQASCCGVAVRAAKEEAAICCWNLPIRFIVAGSSADRASASTSRIPVTRLALVAVVSWPGACASIRTPNSTSRCGNARSSMRSAPISMYER